MDSITNPGPDPNKTKNRLPTMKEDELLRKTIQKEQQRLDELDIEISNLRLEAGDYQQKVQDMESALHVAKTLRTNAENALSSLSALSSSLLDDSDNPAILSAASPTR